MSANCPSRAQIREGRKLLERLKPLARARVAKEGGLQEAGASLVWKAFSPLFYEGNLDYVLITRGENGGWIAGLYIKKYPPGVGNIIGTPVGAPHVTRQEAIEQAVFMIAGAMRREEPQQAVHPVFEWNDYTMNMSPEVLDEILADPVFADTITQEDMLADLAAIETKHFPNGFDPEVACNLPDADRLSVVLLMHGASAKRIFRYPPRAAGMPKQDPKNDQVVQRSCDPRAERGDLGA